MKSRRGEGRFDVALFECWKARDAGPACVWSHVCCEPCLVLDVLTIAGAKNAVAITGLGLVGAAVANSRDGGLAAAGSTVDALAALAARRAIVEKYGIDESASASFALACACMPCSTVQLANEVMRREVGPNGGEYRFSCIGLRESRRVEVEVMDRT